MTTDELNRAKQNGTAVVCRVASRQSSVVIALAADDAVGLSRSLVVVVRSNVDKTDSLLTLANKGRVLLDTGLVACVLCRLASQKISRRKTKTGYVFDINQPSLPTPY